MTHLDFDDLTSADLTSADLYWDDSVARGLRQYVRQVRRALGLRGECSFIQTDGSASAYIALDGHLTRYPDRDLALLWDERHGWAAAVEDHSGDLQVVAYLGQTVLPAPEEVADWTRNLLRAGHPGEQDRVPHCPPGDEVRRRLTAYAGPRFTATSSGS